MTEETLNKFIKSSSFLGLCTVYALVLSKEKQMAFKFKELFEEIFPGSVDYCYGFIVACACFELVNFNYKNDIITVLDVSLLSSEMLNEAIKQQLIPEDPTRIEWVTKVEHYFL